VAVWETFSRAGKQPMAEALRDLPPRPPSEVEWEDLLVRLELMPKALRILLEEPGPELAAIRPLVEGLARKEGWLGEYLQSASGEDGFREAGRVEPADGAAAAELFVRLRARNFAMLQRRGLVVWDWGGSAPDGTPATAYQVLSRTVRNDVESLAAIREALKGGAIEC
jgi:hypothetical protein